MNYRGAIARIQNLDWKSFNPGSIIFVSLFTAEEFADSLRVTLSIFPGVSTLAEMAEGELQTDNLRYSGYERIGDHADFLRHFHNGSEAEYRVAEAYKNYRNVVEAFRANERAMTIISREQELPGIFEEILSAHDWNALGLGFYQYYLSRHIQIDSQESGHRDLTTQFSRDQGFELSPEVLDDFWSARLNLYQEALLP
jgi:hypothetical protein